MRPAPFDYREPTSLLEATGLLAEYRERAAVLAGGQSLIAQLNARRRRPELVLAIAAVPGLAELARRPDTLRIGASLTQRAAAADDTIPVLRAALGHVGHVPTRNRGTVGGSIAFADPSAELPTVLVALGGSVTLCSAVHGDRTVGAGQLFTGPFRTALRPDELLTSVLLPVPPAGARFAFEQRHFRRHAKVSVVAGWAGAHAPPVLAAGGLTDTPVLLGGVGELLDSEADLARGVAVVAEAVAGLVTPNADHYGSVSYRRRLARAAATEALHRVLQAGRCR